MRFSFKSLPDLLNSFQDEQTCREYLAIQRWGKKPVCVHCGNMENIYTIEGGKRYKCSGCKKKFSVTVGTIFEKSHISLNIWFAAIYLATAHKKGISSLQLSRDLGITQKSAWFVLHRVREMLREKNPEILTGTVEADETFVGGKNKNRHASKKVEESQGRSVKDKTPVFGVIQRGGKLNTRVVPDTKAKTLKPIVAELVERGAIVVTDEWNAYKGLTKDYAHHVIRHRDNEYMRDGMHTNTIEGFWSLFKRGIYGIYHYASPKHLHRYTDEFSYRYNTRKELDQERFSSSLTRADGRLTYKQLTAK